MNATGSKIRIVLFDPWKVYFRVPLMERIAAHPRLDLTVIHQCDDYHQAGAVSVVPAYRYRYLASHEPIDQRAEAVKLVELLRTLAPDVLMMHGYVTQLHQLAAWYQKSQRKALLVRENTSLLFDRSLKRKIAKQIGLRATLHGASGLYVGSKNKEWFQHYGVPADRLYFTPYAVDNDYFRTRHEHLLPHRAALRARFGFGDADTPVVLTVCRLAEMKGLPGLLTAFAQLRKHRPVALAIAGAGPLRADLERQVDRMGIPDVHFLGRVGQADLPALYTAADFFVLNSLFDETWGVVVNEAMNCGLPIVVSNMVGSGYDLVRPGSNGFVIPAGNTVALIEKMSLLANDPDMCKSFGARSRELIAPWNHDVAAAGAIAAIEDAVRRPER